jgi:hypothetical protein
MIQFRPIIGNIGGGSKAGMEIVGRMISRQIKSLRDFIPPHVGLLFATTEKIISNGG